MFLDTSTAVIIQERSLWKIAVIIILCFRCIQLIITTVIYGLVVYNEYNVYNASIVLVNEYQPNQYYYFILEHIKLKTKYYIEWLDTTQK